MSIRVLLAFLPGLLAGCAAGPSFQEELDRSTELCRTRATAQRSTGSRTWFSDWLSCRKEHVMPVEARHMPRLTEELRRVYAEVTPLSLRVDSGEMSLPQFYMTWNRIRARARLPYCLYIAQTDAEEAVCMYYR